ncbi:hypothetical protein ACGF5S_27375 [Nocardia nova]|uniref:hypothetical protein n=1 Tax=Nocardia nova TaxID=37330 RepID=UPI0037227F1C
MPLPLFEGQSVPESHWIVLIDTVEIPAAAKGHIATAAMVTTNRRWPRLGVRNVVGLQQLLLPTEPDGCAHGRSRPYGWDQPISASFGAICSP